LSEEYPSQEWLAQPKDLPILRQVVQGNPQLLAHFSAAERAMLDVNHDGQVDEADVEALCAKIMQAEAAHALGAAEKLAHLRDKLR
jgi:hypothetical protein